MGRFAGVRNEADGAKGRMFPPYRGELENTSNILLPVSVDLLCKSSCVDLKKPLHTRLTNRRFC